MSIFLDSASISDAKAIVNLGWAAGITTNPLLLAQSELAPRDTLQQLAKLSPGLVFYQLTSVNLEDMQSEAWLAREILGDKTALKIPATGVGFQALASLAKEIPCAMTAVFSPAQALVACSTGARFVIIYVNRSTKLLGDGLAFTKKVANVIAGTRVELLAASLKSPQEAVEAVQAGAHHITLPLPILLLMVEHPFSLQSVEEFVRLGKGITSC